ncbi:hypothetical protein BDR26DRAFT_530260 [Obelidium mucronatum]|nr:hypothetical protein BDR26DRAFT_530260 [Obelidium mucronatum]
MVAGIVPHCETDKGMPKLDTFDNPAEYCVVEYLEVVSYNIVRKEDLRMFDPSIEPYLSFSKLKGFHNDSAIKRAHEFLETGKPPTKFRWNRWGKSKQMLPEDVTATNPVTLYKIKSALDAGVKCKIPETVVVVKTESKDWELKFGEGLGICPEMPGYDVTTGHCDTEAENEEEEHDLMASGTSGDYNSETKPSTQAVDRASILLKLCGGIISHDAFFINDQVVVYHADYSLWYLAQVIGVDDVRKECTLRYARWGKRWDAAVPFAEIYKLGDGVEGKLAQVHHFFKGMTEQTMYDACTN